MNLVQSGRAVVQSDSASGPQVVIIADPTPPAANRQLIEFRGKVGRIAIEVEGEQSSNPRTGAMVPFSVLKVCGPWRRTHEMRLGFPAPLSRKTHWRFPFKLSKNGADIAKRIVLDRRSRTSRRGSSSGRSLITLLIQCAVRVLRDESIKNVTSRLVNGA